MAAKKRVSLALEELNDHQLLLHVVLPALTSMEKKMADLNQSVADLEAAVDNINSRFAAQLVNLQSALDAANAAADASNTELQQALSDAQAASDAIEGQVSELNSIGADPSTDPVPDPNAPAPDQTLPGDQPTT